MALTTRGRVLATLASVAVVVVSVLLVGHAALNPVSGHTTGATTTLRVPAGDSARDLAARVQPGVDPDITVARILTLNGLPSAAHLEPGMAVTVPVDTPVS